MPFDLVFRIQCVLHIAHSEIWTMKISVRKRIHFTNVKLRSVVFETNRIDNSSRIQMPCRKTIQSSAYFSIILNSKSNEKKRKNRFVSLWIGRGFVCVFHRLYGDAPAHPVSMFVFAIRSGGTLAHYAYTAYVIFIRFFFQSTENIQIIIIIIKRKTAKE